MRIKFIIAAAALTFVLPWRGAEASVGPRVSNLTAAQQQGTELVVLGYDLTDEDSDCLNMRLSVLRYDGVTAVQPLNAASVSGSGVGFGVKPGQGKVVVWDAGKDWDGQYGTDVWFKITADDGQTPPLGQNNMVVIPAGWFQMGGIYGDEWGWERPIHNVYVSEFEIGRFEVSNAEMCRVMQWAYDRGRIVVMNDQGGQVFLAGDTNRCNLLRLAPYYNESDISYSQSRFAVKSGRENFPCAYVSWYGAQAYCNFLSEMEGLEPCCIMEGQDWSSGWLCDFTKNGYRLPTEAEWERAARGGVEGNHFPWPSTGGTYVVHIDGSKANYYGSGDPYEVRYGEAATPIGYYNGNQVPPGFDMANGYGLYDMAGNLAELCYDWYSGNYYAVSPSINPIGPDAAQAPYNVAGKVMRGGTHPWGIEYLRCASRAYVWYPGDTHDWLGFRVARSRGSRSKKAWDESVFGPITVDTRGTSAGVVQMGADKYWVRESAGTVTVSVARIGGKDGPASVIFTTADGTAQTGVDYVSATGLVSWADGDQSNKSVTITLLPESGPQPNRTFQVVLGNVQSAQAGWTMTSTVTIVDRMVFNDYAGDCQSDLAIFDNTNAKWYAATIARETQIFGWEWGWPGVTPVPGDYDGDGQADLAVFDGASGLWYILSATGADLGSGLHWGWLGAVPVPGDYDADGKSDLALFDSLSGNWYIATLADSPSASRPGGLARESTLRLIAWAVEFGWPGARPVSGDYDADGRSDLAVFDNNTGDWYVYSLVGRVIVWKLPWGWPGAIPVPGDYDNDAVNDYTLFDSNTGNWYVLSATGALLGWAVPWGWPGAVPVLGDYDGDGAADLALFDSATGQWYIRTVLGETLSWGTPWGWPGAQPVGASQ